ncbi:hypothetical protein P8631_11075 [Guyparkeria sp. 1SP6A2]|nr:hypothetical protein [Guyparkeria sp. 1SP6A2]
MRDFLVKLLVLLVLSSNLTWAAEQGAEVSSACAPVDVVSAAENSDASDHHTPNSASHHCCHASVHFTGLPNTSVAILRGPSGLLAPTALTDWQTREIEPRLRPPRV